MEQPIVSIEHVRSAELVARIKRFTVMLSTGRDKVQCHIHDPGRLTHLLKPGTRVYYRPSWRPGRKTSCDVVAVEEPRTGTIVLEDTRFGNKLFPLVAHRVIPGISSLTAEKWINGTRVDFIATDSVGNIVLIEVKSTNLVIDRVALFPDAPSQRARRQIEVLVTASKNGTRAAIVFTVLRPDADILKPNRVVDPVFSRLLCAHRNSLELYAYRVEPLIEKDNGDEMTLKVFFKGLVSVEPC
ncbi:DNA/RNA nuclease SfsA [Pyrofollis japonicus]|uniref:DNA/RNA nuclease SfsA n=1 Tax=Pyrofollis japonicus TaxID=3060460 RepID=UPI00295ABDB5|nr:DNA/RNA nuclease SfsA [Pyrofollis japonicus]BEP17966.1 DNA/RNA nuclease SfsA [Pyrofollis japonicus]